MAHHLHALMVMHHLMMEFAHRDGQLVLIRQSSFGIAKDEMMHFRMRLSAKKAEFVILCYQ